MQTEVILKMTTLFYLIPLSSSFHIVACHFSDLKMSSLAKLLHYLFNLCSHIAHNTELETEGGQVARWPGSLQVWWEAVLRSSQSLCPDAAISSGLWCFLTHMYWGQLLTTSLLSEHNLYWRSAQQGLASNKAQPALAKMIVQILNMADIPVHSSTPNWCFFWFRKTSFPFSCPAPSHFEEILKNLPVSGTRFTCWYQSQSEIISYCFGWSPWEDYKHPILVYFPQFLPVHSFYLYSW